MPRPPLPQPGKLSSASGWSESSVRWAESDQRARELLEALPGAQELLPVREDHNTLCDQRLSAASRYRWLNIGRLLVERGLAEDAEDVFYLTFEELLEALETGTAPDERDARRAAAGAGGLPVGAAAAGASASPSPPKRARPGWCAGRAPHRASTAAAHG